ncbi:MAG: LacI family DNA-binding transcriptional regulator [Paracoccaceae bacterium]
MAGLVKSTVVGTRRRVTISDVARYLDLTKGTVSRALNGYADISETTRLRVRRAADQLGYRPLSHAQAIRTGRVRSIGLVLQVNEHDGHRPFVADFLAGVSEGASREDWTLTVATAESEEDTLRLLEKISDERKADGFILPRTQVADRRIDFLRDHGTPFVLYGRTGNTSGCAWYDIQSEDAMTDAVLRLSALGHRRIAFVPGGPGYTYAELRLDGYRDGLDRAGLSIDPALIAQPAVDREAGGLATETLLDLPDRPTAIVFAVDQAAFGAYDAARRHGLKIGRDLSLIAYDGIPESSFVDPPLSTYAVDTRKAGERLADLLIRRARGADPEELRELDKARFLNRGSHGPAPRGAQISP